MGTTREQKIFPRTSKKNKKKDADRPIVDVHSPSSMSQKREDYFSVLSVSPLGLASILVPASPQNHSHPSLSTMYCTFVGPLLPVTNWLEKGSSPSSFLLLHSRGILLPRHSKNKETAAIELRIPRVSLFGNEKSIFCGGALFVLLTENNSKSRERKGAGQTNGACLEEKGTNGRPNCRVIN